MTNNDRLTIKIEVIQQEDIVEIVVTLFLLPPKKSTVANRGLIALFSEDPFFFWMINGARVLPRMPVVKNKRDTRGHNKGVPAGRWASCRAPNSLTYHWGRLSCKRFPHR